MAHGRESPPPWPRPTDSQLHFYGPPGDTAPPHPDTAPYTTRPAAFAPDPRARFAPPPRHSFAPSRPDLAPPVRRAGYAASRHSAGDRGPAGRRTLRGIFRRPDANRWHWLLLVPIVAPLLPPFYNRLDPAFLGLPFFYWVQLGFLFLSSVIIVFLHLKVR